ncbi:hypothetical protein ACQ4PT_005494 [Festuca glaucescens]
MGVTPQPVIDEVMANELTDGCDEEENDGTSGDETTSVGEGNETTDAGDGNGTTDAGGGNVTTDGNQSKMQWKERHRNTLKTSMEEVYEVDHGSGEPLLPETVVAGYDNDLGCILRDTVSINEMNMRDPIKNHLVTLLITKLHKRFKFLEPYNDEEDLTSNLVNTHALGKFSPDLSSWKSRLRKMASEGVDFFKVHKAFPQITEEEWRIFKDTCAQAETKDTWQWGLDMRAKNIGCHNLGSQGYFHMRPKWTKEDSLIKHVVKTNPWDEYEDQREHEFIRSRYHVDHKTGDLVMCENIEDVMKEMKTVKSQSSSSQGSAPWDTPFNRALNKVLGKPLDKRPKHGRVIAAGNGARWDHYYQEGKDQRKERKRLAQASTVEEIDKIVDEKTRFLIQDELTSQFQAILPTMVQSMKNWYDGGQQGSCPIPNFGMSNSNNEAPLNSPTMVTPPNIDAPGREDSLAGTTPSSTHSIISGMPDGG